MTRTRILIVHENPVLAGQAARLLNLDPQLQVVDLITSAQEAHATISSGGCDVVLVSAALSKNGALQLLKCCRQQNASVKVIVTGLTDDPKQMRTYVAAGAAGYILKKAGITAWAAHLQAIRNREPQISPTLTTAVMKLNALNCLPTRFDTKALRQATFVQWRANSTQAAHVH